MIVAEYTDEDLEETSSEAKLSSAGNQIFEVQNSYTSELSEDCVNSQQNGLSFADEDDAMQNQDEE